MSAIDSMLDSPLQRNAARELMQSHSVTELEAVNVIMAVRLGVQNDKVELIEAAVAALESRQKKK